MDVHVELHTHMHQTTGLMIRIATHLFWQPEILAVTSGGNGNRVQPCTPIDIIYIHIEPGGAYA